MNSKKAKAIRRMMRERGMNPAQGNLSLLSDLVKSPLVHQNTPKGTYRQAKKLVAGKWEPKANDKSNRNIEN